MPSQVVLTQPGISVRRTPSGELKAELQLGRATKVQYCSCQHRVLSKTEAHTISTQLFAFVLMEALRRIFLRR